MRVASVGGALDGLAVPGGLTLRGGAYVELLGVEDGERGTGLVADSMKMGEDELSGTLAAVADVVGVLVAPRSASQSRRCAWGGVS